MVEQKKSHMKAIVIIAIILFAVFMIVLFMYKYNNTTFSWKYFIIYSIGGVAVLAGVPGGYWYLIHRDKSLLDKLKKDLISLPEAITVDECRKIRDRMILEEYENYIDTPQYEDTPSLGIGVKNSIYVCLADAKYDDPYASEKYARFLIAINMHYPDKKLAIMKDPTPAQIERTISRISNSPEGDPDVREIVERNALMGTERVTKETMHNKEKKEEKKEKEDFEETKEETQ